MQSLTSLNSSTDNDKRVFDSGTTAEDGKQMLDAKNVATQVTQSATNLNLKEGLVKLA